MMQHPSMVIASLVFCLSISLGACAQKGPAIKAGEQIDQSEKTVDPQSPSENPGESVVEIIEETLDETTQADKSLEEDRR
jgi:hypothetical protein